MCGALSAVPAIYNIPAFEKGCHPVHRQRKTSSRRELVVPLWFAIIDPQRLGELDIVEPALPIGEWAHEQSVDLGVSDYARCRLRRSCEPLVSQSTHLLVCHPITKLAQPPPHLPHIHPSLVPLVKAGKRLENVMLRIQLQKMLAHHRQELGEIDA